MSASNSYTDGFAAGAAAERNRIVGILQSEEAKKRPALALEMAIETPNLTAEAASRLLARTPVEGVSSGGNYLLGMKPTPPGQKSGLMAIVEEEAARMMANAGGASSPAPAGSSHRPKNGLEAMCEEFARASGLPPR